MKSRWLNRGGFDSDGVDDRSTGPGAEVTKERLRASLISIAWRRPVAVRVRLKPKR